MALSRAQVAQLFSRDADRYEEEKQKALQQLGKTTPYAGLEKLTNIGVGAITGGLSGGLGGAVMGGISGSNASNPIEAGVGGYSMGAGLNDIANVTPQMNIPGGVSGEVAKTVGKQQDLGQLMRPENFNKTSELFKGLTGKQSGEDVLSKIGTINKEAITKQELKDQKQLEYDRKLEEARIKRKQEKEDALTKHRYTLEEAKVKKSTTTTQTPEEKKALQEEQKKNYLSAVNNINKAYNQYGSDVEMLKQYYSGLKDIADDLWLKGKLNDKQYNDIIKRIQSEE